MIHVFHLETDPLWRERVIEEARQSHVVSYLGASRYGTTVLNALITTHIDLIVSEYALPDMNIRELLCRLCGIQLPPRVLLITSLCHCALLHALSNPLVAGMLWKPTYSRDEITTCLHTINEGRKFYSPEIALRHTAFRANPNAFHKVCSNSELELMRYWANGEADILIARRIGVKPGTIKAHRLHVLRKLGLSNSSELVSWALENGFASPKAQEKIAVAVP